MMKQGKIGFLHKTIRATDKNVKFKPIQSHPNPKRLSLHGAQNANLILYRTKYLTQNINSFSLLS